MDFTTVNALTVTGSLPVHKATETHSSSQRRSPLLAVKGRGAASRHPPHTRHTTCTSPGITKALGRGGRRRIELEWIRKNDRCGF